MKTIFNTLLKCIKALGHCLILDFEEAGHIMNACMADLAASIKKILAPLASLTRIFIIIIRIACTITGADESLIGMLNDSEEKIIQSPEIFFNTLFKGIFEGLVAFTNNLADNIKAIGKNLINIWLKPLKLKCPDFSPIGLLKFGLDILGLDINGIMKKLGLTDVLKAASLATSFGENKKTQNAHNPHKRTACYANDIASYDAPKETPPPASETEALALAISNGGIEALLPYVRENLWPLIGDVLLSFAKSLTVDIAKKVIEKIAMLATPIGGIASAIKATWDVFEYFKDHFQDFAEFISALGSCIGCAANGDTQKISSFIEASLCQAIPLAIEIFLRMLGINIGEKIKSIVEKLRAAIEKLLAPVTKWIKTSTVKMLKKTRKTLDTSNDGNPNTNPNPTKNSLRDKIKISVVDRMDQAQTDIENQIDDIDAYQRNKEISHDIKLQKTHYTRKNSINRFDKLGLKSTNISDIIEKKEKAKEENAFNFTGLADAMNGKKEGSLGINLHKLDAIKNADEKYALKRYANASHQMEALKNKPYSKSKAKKEWKLSQTIRENGSFLAKNGYADALLEDMETRMQYLNSKNPSSWLHAMAIESESREIKNTIAKIHDNHIDRQNAINGIDITGKMSDNDITERKNIAIKNEKDEKEKLSKKLNKLSDAHRDAKKLKS